MCDAVEKVMTVKLILEKVNVMEENRKSMTKAFFTFFFISITLARRGEVFSNKSQQKAISKQKFYAKKNNFKAQSSQAHLRRSQTQVKT